MELLAEIDEGLAAWIAEQPMFFVASAPLAADGHVNLSPKGYDSLRVLGPTRVAYLDLTGSGAETIAHVRENGRITIMCCAFHGPPRIVRLHGRAEVHLLGSAGFAELAPHFPAETGTRSIVDVQVERVSTSCGFAVPLLDLRGERPTLRQWANRKDPDSLRAYWSTKNTTSIDGLPAVDA